MTKLFSVYVLIYVLSDIATISTTTYVNGTVQFQTFRTVSPFEAIKAAAKLNVPFKNSGHGFDMFKAEKSFSEWR